MVKKLKNNLENKSKKLKINIPALSLALKNKNTPKLAKFFAAITVCYALSPIDLVPDFIPILGYLDDLLLIPILVTITLKLIPDDIFKQCQKQAEGMWAEGKPKKWYYSLPIFVFWLIVIILIFKIIN